MVTRRGSARVPTAAGAHGLWDGCPAGLLRRNRLPSPRPLGDCSSRSVTSYKLARTLPSLPHKVLPVLFSARSAARPPTGIFLCSPHEVPEPGVVCMWFPLTPGYRCVEGRLCGWATCSSGYSFAERGRYPCPRLWRLSRGTGSVDESGEEALTRWQVWGSWRTEEREGSMPGRGNHSEAWPSKKVQSPTHWPLGGSPGW